MQDTVNNKEIEKLQLRIDKAPIEARAEMQAQLDALMRNLTKQETKRTDAQLDEDAVIESQFDNMPV